jgi:para-nitrobenzyl esterase
LEETVMPNRRTVLGASLGLIATAGTTRADSAPEVTTAYGKIRGANANGVSVFKGIPYGASTAGKNRFMPPVAPQPWTGVREAVAYAGRSPQAPGAAQRPELANVWGPVDTLPVGEDCLTLHVWTPGLDGAKRPVMVWLHGGAFSYGSANSPRYDSTNLAKRNDVVVVAVNHRLNIFGHLDLSAVGGEQFAQSGNVGVLDLVTALQWVRDHAARFGGDPGNVMIFGQSGGGGKVSALLAMPVARGLFHKAVIESGASVRFAERERTTQLADAVLKHLGLGPNQLDDLQKLPVAKLQEAIVPAQKTLSKPHYPLLDRYNFGPVIDGKLLPAQPFDPVATALSDDIPLMIGGTRTESSIFLAPDDAVWNRAITEDDLAKRIAALAGDKADGLLAYYKQHYPNASPTDRLLFLTTGSNFEVRSMMLGERKAARGKAQVWMYRFDWETPAYGGRLRSPHSMEVPFVFDTLGVIGEQHKKEGYQALADKVSKTWATFARTGDPSNPSLPAWPAYSADHRNTMLFNDTCQVVVDPDGEARQLWSKAATV